MEKAKRQSNFELLRIFAIVLIILYHIQRYGSQPLLTGNYGYFSTPEIDPRLLVFEIGGPFGGIGNGLFIMISGYFMNANLHIDTGKIAKKLLLQLGFAVTLLVIANAVWVTFFKNETLSLEMATIGDFNNGWWFIGYYFFVILLAKVFLNGFTAKLTQSQFKALLLTILAVSQFGWSGTFTESIATGALTLLIGVFYFLMGGYIARYNPFENLKAYTFILVIAAAYALRFISAYNIASQAIDEFIKSNAGGSFIHSVQGYSNHEITVVIIVVCIFELFRRLNIPYNAAVNFVGKATLMIYFIHENGIFRMFFKNEHWMELLRGNVLAYCLKWLEWAAIGFAVGLAAYVVYTLLGKILPRMRSLFVVKDTGK